jgi:hypothetical protein
MMSEQTEARLRDAPEPTAGELQMGIFALSGIVDVLFWIEHEQMPGSDDDLLEVKHELINAAKLIVADFKRRF